VRDYGGIGGPGEGRRGVNRRGEGGRRGGLGDHNASMMLGERKMRKMRKNEKRKQHYFGLSRQRYPANFFRGVSPSSFLNTFVSPRFFTG
jgi:hypothetical protein